MLHQATHITHCMVSDNVVSKQPARNASTADTKVTAPVYTMYIQRTAVQPTGPPVFCIDILAQCFAWFM